MTLMSIPYFSNLTGKTANSESPNGFQVFKRSDSRISHFQIFNAK